MDKFIKEVIRRLNINIEIVNSLQKRNNEEPCTRRKEHIRRQLNATYNGERDGVQLALRVINEELARFKKEVIDGTNS